MNTLKLTAQKIWAYRSPLIGALILLFLQLLWNVLPGLLAI
ncbi:MAG: hypothetical protein REI78_03965 [Pedobacter sp.]|nr:hypothetical protein [Pedobacter sp.]